MTTNKDFFSGIKKILQEGKEFHNKDEYYLFVTELEYFFIQKFGERMDSWDFEVRNFLDSCWTKVNWQIPIVEPFDYTIYI